MKRYEELISILKDECYALEQQCRAQEDMLNIQTEQLRIQEILKLKAELEDARRQAARNRENWFQVYEDMEKEKKKETRKCLTENRRLRKMCREALCSRDRWKEKYLEQLQLKYEAETALEAEKGKNLKLMAQLNRDYENSSIPSSKTIHHKKITNSREKSGKKPGGQPGHKGHGRRRQTPTMPPVLLAPPQEILDDPDFKKTKKTDHQADGEHPSCT